MIKEENKNHEFHIKTLTSELLHILMLFFIVGIGFVVLMFWMKNINIYKIRRQARDSDFKF